MEHLTSIIDEISKIEDRANIIINSANTEKNQLLVEHEQRLKEFDEILKQQTQQKITEIQTNLKKQIQHDLDLQRAKTDDILNAIQTEYDETHTHIVNDIVKIMIGA